MPREGYTTFASFTTPHPSGECAPGWVGDPTSNFCYQVSQFVLFALQFNLGFLIGL